MYMTKVGIVTGIILIGIALLGYFGSGMESWTALIPSLFGLPILAASMIARLPEKLKLGMHIASVFGLLGLIAPLGRIIPSMTKGTFTFNLAGFALLSMAVICGTFLFLCVKYFIDVRRSK